MQLVIVLPLHFVRGGGGFIKKKQEPLVGAGSEMQSLCLLAAAPLAEQP